MMRQFDMWDIGLGLSRHSDLLEPVFYPALQRYQRRVLVDADPQRVSAKMTDTRERQHKSGRLDLQQGGSDIGCRRIVDWTDKAQRQMELAGGWTTRRPVPPYKGRKDRA